MLAVAGVAWGQPVTPAPEPSTPGPAAEHAVKEAVTGAGVPVDAVNLVVVAMAGLCMLGLIAADVLRPGSFTRRKPVLAANGSPAMLLVLAFMVYASLSFGGALAYAALPFPKEVSRLTVKGMAWLQLGSHAVAVPAAIAVFVVVMRQGLAGAVSLKDAWWGFVTLLVSGPIVMTASLAAAWLATRINHEAPDPIAHNSLNAIMKFREEPWGIAIMVSAVVFAPVVEEVMYRMLIQTAVIRVTQQPWVGVVLTAAGFAAMHTVGGAVPWHATLPLFVLGLAMGIAYARTGRIGVSIVCHMLFNAGNVAAALWMK